MRPANADEHAALARLVVDYAYALDERRFEALDDLFLPDAWIDYTAMGGIKGYYPEVRAWLPGALGAFPGYLHLVGNLRFDVAGDEAKGTVACFNPMVLPPPLAEQPGQTLCLGLWYHDRYRRTAAGWRFAERVETRSFAFNVPEALRAMLG